MNINRIKTGLAADLALRSVLLLFLGTLVLLPVAAISFSALKGGLARLVSEICHPQALYALALTLKMALVMVLINIVTGTATAWVLIRYDFPGRKLINSLVDIPFAIPTVVTGMMLVVLYGPRSFLGGFLEKNGIEIIFNKPGIVLALLFVTFPFVVRSVQPVLMEMDQDMEEAAQTLGASKFLIFFRIVLPTLLPSILSGAALSFSRALGEFGSIVIVAGNIPMKTQVASVFVYGEIESANIQSALGVSVLLLLISFLVLLLLNMIRKWSNKHANE